MKKIFYTLALFLALGANTAFADTILDYHHDQPLNAAYTLQTSNTSAYAQSFTAPSDFDVTGVNVYYKKGGGASGDLTFTIVQDTSTCEGGFISSCPDTSAPMTADTVVPDGDITSSFAATGSDVNMTSITHLTSGTKYWLLINRTGSLSGNYNVGRDSSLTYSADAIGSVGGNWFDTSPSGRSLSLRVYGTPYSPPAPVMPMAFAGGAGMGLLYVLNKLLPK